MKASIVVATYNRKDKLEKCLNALANQTYPKDDYEIIIVDDGSTDGTYEFLKEKQKEIKNLRIFRQNNKGPASARNLGVKNAKGEVIFFTDDDVIVPNNWIEEFLKVFEKYPEVVAVGGYLEASEEMIKRNIFAKYEAYMSRLVYNMPNELYIGGVETFGVVTCNAAYKKKVIEEVGYFDETFPVAAGEDADLKLRVALKGYKFAFIPLKAIHIQDYNFKRFYRQLKARKIGELYFINKWKHVLNDVRKNDGESRGSNLILKVLRTKDINFIALFIFSSIYGIIYKKVIQWKKGF
jgi:GT2 family glycosyltransferase